MVDKRVRFHPQAWVNDYAVEVDPEGPTVWVAKDVDPAWVDDDYDSDNLSRQDEAPEWVQNWGGPFWIEILDRD